MEPISREVSESAADAAAKAAASAWERNMLALFRLFGKSPAVEYVETPHFARWHTRLFHPYFEGVQVFAPPPDAADAFIEEQVAYFRERGASFFSWWLRPPLTNPDWQAALLAHGFSFDPGGPYMALKLDELPDAVRWPEGLEIRVVEDTTALSTWIDTFERGYGFQPEWVEPFASIYQPLGFDLPLRHYIGYLHGAPAAVSTLFLAEGVAGIWNVAALAEARGQGLGSAITWQPLCDARQMGYSIAALDSTQMGYPIYYRLGFREVPCRGNFYKKI